MYICTYNDILSRKVAPAVRPSLHNAEPTTPLEGDLNHRFGTQKMTLRHLHNIFYNFYTT